MIVVDTSALVAILLAEPLGTACAEAIVDADDPLISVGTMAEALIVAERKGFRLDMQRLIDGLGMDVVPVTSSLAKRVGDA